MSQIPNESKAFSESLSQFSDDILRDGMQLVLDGSHLAEDLHRSADFLSRLRAFCADVNRLAGRSHAQRPLMHHPEKTGKATDSPDKSDP